MPTEKEILEREIAKLTGAIDSRSRTTSHGNPRAAPARAHPYKFVSNQRGGNRTFRPGQQSSSTPTPASSRTSTPNLPASVAGPSESRTPVMGTDAERWVNSTSKRGNKSLVNPEIYLQQQKARLAHTAIPKKDRSARGPRRAYDASTTSDGRKVVTIDGVVYEFEGDGRKLKRIEDTEAVSTQPDIITPARSSVSISGEQYVRTRNGNLIRRKSLAKKSIVRKDQPCRYFTKTGSCKRAQTCPYVHNPDKISICSKFLRGNCPHSDSTCPVSHRPNPHNAPSCVHFQRTGQCRNGDECRYPHLRVADGAPVCLDFSTIGWCDRGADCPERHAWECREYSEKGECKKGKKCELMHILRARTASGGESANQNDQDMETNGGLFPATTGPGGAESESMDSDEDSDGTVDSDEEQEEETPKSKDDIAAQQDFIQFHKIDGGEEPERSA